MKRTLLIMLALLLTAGMANAQNVKTAAHNTASKSCMDMGTAIALGLESHQTANTPNRNVLVFADFEDGSWGGLTYSSSSNYPFAIADADNGSLKCIKSTNGGNASTTSDIEVTYTYAEEGYINFDAKCMGEGSSTYWDHCDFYIDGTQQFTHGADIASQGWVNYNFEVAAGSHTFKFSYTKDSSVNPTGDYMAVDNIAIGSGSPCIAPASITVNCNFTTAVCTWGGFAESFNLRYRAVGTSTWTTVNGITENTYTITGLAEYTDYEVEVAAGCDANNWTPQEFTTSGSIQSNATFYGYATYDIGNGGYEDKYVTFSPQNPAVLTVASSEIPETYSASYALGYLWYITTSSLGNNLGKAPIDADGNIGTPETVASGFDSEASVGMAFNNADGLMYYVTVASSVYTLKSFNPMAAEAGATTIGTIEAGAQVFAIDAEGNGYCISSSNGNLYSLNLTDATTTLIGNTGVSLAYVQSMAFDMETGELFWAQIYSGDEYGFYRVNTETGNAEFIGQLGGGMEMTGMFMVWGEMPDCATPTNLTVSNVTNHEATITWTAGGTETLWQVTLNGQTQEVSSTTLELTGLDAETNYTISVAAICSADETSFAVTEHFTTEVACAQPTNVQVDVVGLNANVTWEGDAGEYNLRYKPYSGPEGAIVTLTVGDVWGDGSGYQMLLDADATAYGDIIPTSGALTSSGDVPASTYAEFEYKIPENADGALSTQNIVLNNSISIEVPAGIYDWCITNPTPGDRMWIAASNGNVGGRQDDYEFEAGFSYEFVPSTYGSNDGVDVTITSLTKDDTDWTVVTGITDTHYTIEGLEPNTQYAVQVQAVCGGIDGESAWTPNTTFETTDGISETETGIIVWNRAGEIRVELANGGNYTMNVVNILGQSVLTSNVNGQGSHIVKHNLSNGIYVVTLSNSDNTFSTKIVVK